MRSFSAKTKSGKEILGIGLNEQDLTNLKSGEHILIDLASVGVGFWVKSDDGGRSFLQPRDSFLLVMQGDSRTNIGDLFGVSLPALGEPDGGNGLCP